MRELANARLPVMGAGFAGNHGGGVDAPDDQMTSKLRHLLADRILRTIRIVREQCSDSAVKK